MTPEQEKLKRAFGAMSPEQRARLRKLTPEQKNAFTAKVMAIPDEGDAASGMEPQRPVSTPSESTNRLPDQYNPSRRTADTGVVDFSGPDAGVNAKTRVFLSAAKNDQEAINILKKQGYEPAMSPEGNLVVKKNGKLYAIDPTGIDTGDIAGLGPAAASTVLSAAPLLLGPIGVGAMLGSEAAAGAASSLLNSAIASKGGAYSDKTGGQVLSSVGEDAVWGSALNAGTAGLFSLLGKLGVTAKTLAPGAKATKKTLTANPALARGRELIVDETGKEPLSAGISSSPIIGSLTRIADRSVGKNRITESLESQMRVQQNLMDKVQEPLRKTVLAGTKRQDPTGMLPASGNNATDMLTSILQGRGIPRGQTQEVTEEALTKSIDIYKAEAEKLYDDIGRKIGGDTTIVPQSQVDALVDEIDNLLTIDPNASGLNIGGSVVARLRGIRNELKAPPPKQPVPSGLFGANGNLLPAPPPITGPLTVPVTYNTFRKMKTELGRTIGWQNTWMNGVDAAAARVYGQMGDALTQTATNAAPHLGNQLKVANKWYHDVRELFGGPVAKALEKGEASTMLRGYFNTTARVKSLKTVLKDQPEVYSGLRNTYVIDDVMKIKPTDPLYAIDVQGARARLQDMKTNGLYDDLLDQGEQAQLDDMLTLAEAAQSVISHRTALYDLLEKAKGPQGETALAGRFLDDMDKAIIKIQKERGQTGRDLYQVFRGVIPDDDIGLLSDALSVAQVQRKTLLTTGRTSASGEPVPVSTVSGILSTLMVPVNAVLSSGISRFLTSEAGKKFLTFGPQGYKAAGAYSGKAARKLTPAALDRIIKLTTAASGIRNLPANQNKRRGLGLYQPTE